MKKERGHFIDSSFCCPAVYDRPAMKWKRTKKPPEQVEGKHSGRDAYENLTDIPAGLMYTKEDLEEDGRGTNGKLRLACAEKKAFLERPKRETEQLKQHNKN